ncbi:pheromone shutdown-related protein TraB [Methanohalophilus levihalophilus]|uniref:TraB/GumN family protein n=1 Tax=Methanohalophilus levihalophilus TaxID=1431282 RepID=UPI001AE22F6C|nr:TraB/GumN family protein [Methanohalophilus levihalophilus]MBP2029914.1 pheromone shutdown-related protein TraB [Methanohalophilus levihalophilus]
MEREAQLSGSSSHDMDYSYDNVSSSGDHPSAYSDSAAEVPEGAEPRKSRIVIVGTAHVSEKSVQEVRETIQREKPDIVAVELCRARYEALQNPNQSSSTELPIKEMLTGGKFYFLLIQVLLSYVQKKIGSEMGVDPGSEMIAAIDAAKAEGHEIALVDRDIQVTMQRFWSSMGFFEKARMMWELISAALGIGGGQEVDMDNITSSDAISVLTEELRDTAPNASKTLIDERDAYIAGNLVNLVSGGGKTVVAVVGAGHKPGIQKYLTNPSTIPPMQSLVEIPKPRFNIVKMVGFALVALALLTFILLIFSGTPVELLLLAFAWWFIINGVLSAAGAALAKGHPYSVLTAFGVAWLTSLNPMMAAGWFAGLMEAKQRHPTGADLKEITELETFGEMQNNNFFRVIMVAALANIGSVIGTILGVYVMVTVTGLDPRDIIEAGFNNLMIRLGL